MSAHCETCGSDLVYGRGDDWQLMTCPLCEARVERDRMREALEKIASLDEDDFKSAWHYQQAVRFFVRFGQGVS